MLPARLQAILVASGGDEVVGASTPVRVSRRRGLRRPWRRNLLTAVLASIAVNAALGIYALTVPHFGQLQKNVLLTSLCVTGAGVVSLACLPAWERGRLSPAPAVTVAVAVIGLAMTVGGIWAGAFGHEPLLEKTVWTLLLLGAAGALSSLLGLAELAARFRWALTAALLSIAVLIALVVSAVWGQWDSQWFARAVGVVAILVAALTLAIPILHRAGRQELVEEEVRAGARVRFCPSCGRVLSAATGEETACPDCGVKFVVRLRRAAGG